MDRIGIEMTTEGMGICKISVELMAEIEAEVLTEAIVVIGVGQEKEVYPPGSMTIIIVKMATLDLDQGLGSRSSSRITTDRDRIRCYRC